MTAFLNAILFFEHNNNNTWHLEIKLCVNSFENNNDVIHRHQVETTSHNMTVKRKMFNQRNGAMVFDSKTGMG